MLYQVTIEGRQLSVPGAMNTWCTEESADGSGHVTFIRRVEDVALRHYAQHGYPQGWLLVVGVLHPGNI